MAREPVGSGYWRPPLRLPPPFQGDRRERIARNWKAEPGRFSLRFCFFFPGLFLARGSTREEPLASGGDRTKRRGGGWVFLRETRKTRVSSRGWPAWVFSGASQRSPAGKGNLPCVPTAGHVQLGLSGLPRIFKVPEKRRLSRTAASSPT